MNPFDSLRASPLQFRYPGRFIIIGKDADSYVVLYGATGRSPSSLARKLVRKDHSVFMTAADETVSKEGNPELLEYPALKVIKNGLVVANGRQIENISNIEKRDARKQLSYAMSEEAYEPDEYRTPRITGLLAETQEGMDGALHITRSAIDGIDHSSWTVPFESGKGLFISTYVGEDVKPTPSFGGDPLPVALNFGSAKNAVHALFDSFAPRERQTDYRVGFVGVYLSFGKPLEIAIVNRIS
ncbi:MAG: IMP cyclohydrolase [Patescibacteria group bacterium]